MKEIIAALKKTMADLKARANAALQKLGPVDQVQASSEVIYALNSMGWSVDEIERMLEKATELEAKYPSEIEAAAASGLAQAIASGEVVKKADNEAAVIAAKAEGEKIVRAEFAAAEQRATLIASRRKEVEKAHGADAAASLSEDALTADGFDALKVEFARRATELATLGIKPAEKREVFESIACGAAFDEAGNRDFDARVSAIRSAVGLRPSKVPVAASTQPPAASATSVSDEPAVESDYAF